MITSAGNKFAAGRWLLLSSLLVLVACNTLQAKSGEEKNNRALSGQAQTVPASVVTGEVKGELRFQNEDRTYVLYTPDAYKNDKPAALVLALHGGHGNARVTVERTGFNEIADREGFLVLYPEGIDNNWNDGRDMTTSKADDVGFLTTLIDHIAGQRSVDRRRVYVTGLSNGGMMTQRLACEAPDRFAAYATVIANFPVKLEPVCKLNHPAPMMIIGSKADALMPWEGGEIKKGRLIKGGGGITLSAENTAKFWANKNQCQDKYDYIQLPDKDPNDGTRIEMFKYAGCKNGAEVILYAIDGGGHTWPGSKTKSRLRIIGKTSQDMNASEVIWAFFKRHGSQ